MDTTVVYILADNRSGSTLLDYLLSCHPEATSLGELHHLHGYYYEIGVGQMYKWRCSCGVAVRDCDVWSRLLHQVSFSESFKTRLNYRESKWSIVAPVIHERAINKAIADKDVSMAGKVVAENCWKVYQAHASETRKSIVIDSSKDALEAFFLYKHKKQDIRFLLLERDIRAVAYSKLNRAKELQHYYGNKDRSIYTHILSSYKVLQRNRLIAKKLQREEGHACLKKINYSDLANDPDKVMADICTFLGVSTFSLPQTTNQNGPPSHTLGGSPSRYVQREIKPDTRWATYFHDKPVASRVGQILQNLGSKESDRDF